MFSMMTNGDVFTVIKWNVLSILSDNGCVGAWGSVVVKALHY